MKGHFKVVQFILDFCGFLITPSTWRRPVVERISRQIVFSGIEAVPYLVVIGGCLGMLFSLYGQLWLEYTRRHDLLFPLFATAILREAAPLFAVMLSLVASGAPTVSELSLMKVSGEVRLLERQGIHPFQFLVVPRAIGQAIACGCGAVVIAAAGLVTSAYFLSEARHEWTLIYLLNRFLAEIDGRDLGLMLLKAVVNGAIMVLVISSRAFQAGVARTEVPLAAARSMTMAIIWVTAWFFLVTWLSYMYQA